jgi:ElaB/YqjD/DUF883 family membrane-anchored ribosome-binding protein
MSKKEQPADEKPTPPVEPVEPVDPEELPEVKAAAEAIRAAQAELEKACETYKHLRKEATDQVRKLRESTVGDVVEGTLKAVKKHPALGVGIAAFVGFFLGRLFRR